MTPIAMALAIAHPAIEMLTPPAIATAAAAPARIQGVQGIQEACRDSSASDDCRWMRSTSCSHHENQRTVDEADTGEQGKRG